MALAIRATRNWTPFVLVVLLLCGGCGPVEYVNQVTRKASSQVAAADSVNAAKYSPYYYTRAVLYLRRAREEAGYADFQAANRFGRLAAEAAGLARAEAVRRAANPDDDTYIDATKKTAVTPPNVGSHSETKDAGPRTKAKGGGSDDDEEVPPGAGGAE